jgi:hypothetical protein
MIRVVISDAEMRARLGATRGYTLVLLRSTPQRQDPGADAIVGPLGGAL